MKPLKRGGIEHDTLGLVNCAMCGKELLGEKTAARLSLFQRAASGYAVIARRIYERPYCSGCVKTLKNIPALIDIGRPLTPPDLTAEEDR
jgi:hypothetical protein